MSTQIVSGIPKQTQPIRNVVYVPVAGIAIKGGSPLYNFFFFSRLSYYYWGYHTHFFLTKSSWYTTNQAANLSAVSPTCTLPVNLRALYTYVSLSLGAFNVEPLGHLVNQFFFFLPREFTRSLLQTIDQMRARWLSMGCRGVTSLIRGKLA